MSTRRHIVWLRYEAGEPWVQGTGPISERQAVREVRDARNIGNTEAKALPEGVDPNAERKAS